MPMACLCFTVAALALATGLALSHEFTRSCTKFPTRWEITSLELNTLNKPLHKFTKIALDFDADKQAGLMYTRSTVTGETKLLLRVVNDYNKGLTYVMKSSGDCTRYQLTESLVKEIPSGATGTSTEQDYMGTDLFFDLRRYDIPDVNNATTTTFAFTPVGDGECVPLFMGAVNAAIGMDSLFVYTQFKNGTTHPEWFDVPSKC